MFFRGDEEVYGRDESGHFGVVWTCENRKTDRIELEFVVCSVRCAIGGVVGDHIVNGLIVAKHIGIL